jgi:hypothetical protein
LGASYHPVYIQVKENYALRIRAAENLRTRQIFSSVAILSSGAFFYALPAASSAVVRKNRRSPFDVLRTNG